MAQEIHDDVCRNGFDEELGSFVQSYGSKWLDGSLLLIPTTGFLPLDDRRVRGTVAAIEGRLLQDGFVMRHDPAEVETGLRHGEGAFIACSFWLVDAMVMTGRAEEGQKLFERLLDAEGLAAWVGDREVVVDEVRRHWIVYVLPVAELALAFVLMFAGTFLIEPADPGDYVSTAWIPGNLLNEGLMTVQVAVCEQTAAGVQHHCREEAVALHVRDPVEGDSARGHLGGQWRGAVRPLLDWTLRTAELDRR